MRWFAVAPQAQESVRLGWQSLGYRDPQAGYFFGLFPKRDHVQALFEWGALLVDEQHPLEGSGTQVRYVTHKLDEPTRELRWGMRAAGAAYWPERQVGHVGNQIGNCTAR